MAKPMSIDFPVVLADEDLAHQFAGVAKSHGYQPRLYKDEEAEGWDVICVKEMILTYDTVIAMQDELNDLSMPLGGYSDGWGTAGNLNPWPKT